MNILLGVTGSVSARLWKKLEVALGELGEVRTVMTETGWKMAGCPINDHVLRDHHEWVINGRDWDLGDPVLHIDLKNWADVYVVAPCTANTLSKIALGLSDNLVTNVARAWPDHKPMFVAPAMNTDMWNNHKTTSYLQSISGGLKNWNQHPCIRPQTKTLACGDYGIGALANVSDIVQHIKNELTWTTPIKNQEVFVPQYPHPGAFGAVRKFDTHTGVDLYTKHGVHVFPVEMGVVVDIVDFTGSKVKDEHGNSMSWWNDTKAVLVKGASGVVVYGEIQPSCVVGEVVSCKNPIGYVIPVLPDHKLRPDIPHHSTSMLHIELYESAAAEKDFRWGVWKNGEPQPKGLRDPTQFLLNMSGL